MRAGGSWTWSVVLDSGRCEKTCVDVCIYVCAYEWVGGVGGWHGMECGNYTHLPILGVLGRCDGPDWVWLGGWLDGARSFGGVSREVLGIQRWGCGGAWD